MIIIDKGLNDAWVRPEHVATTGPGRYAITLTEPRKIVFGLMASPTKPIWRG